MSIGTFLKPSKNSYPVSIEYAEKFTRAIFNVYWDTKFLRKQQITIKKLQLQTDYGNRVLNLDLLIAISEHKKITELYNLVGCMFSKLNKPDALLLAHLLTVKDNKFKKVYGKVEEEFLNNFKARHVSERINFHINKDYALYKRPILPQLSLPCHDITEIFKKYDTVYVQEKYDGERVIIKYFENQFKLQNRTGAVTNEKKEQLIDLASHFTEFNDFIIDAELLYTKNDEILPFNVKDKFTDTDIKAKCVIFDLIQYGGTNCLNLPFKDRFDLLKTFVNKDCLAETVDTTSIDKLEAIINEKFAQDREGVIVRPNIPYSENQRTIFKIKKLYTKYKVDVDLAVIGGSYNVKRELSILHCAMIQNDTLKFVTKVSSGLTKQNIDYFTRLFKSDYSNLTNEFVEKYKDQINRKMANKPDLLFNGFIIVQVYGDSWSADGSIRFPVFVKIRDDKIYPDSF